MSPRHVELYHNQILDKTQKTSSQTSEEFPRHLDLVKTGKYDSVQTLHFMHFVYYFSLILINKTVPKLYPDPVGQEYEKNKIQDLHGK